MGKDKWQYNTRTVCDVLINSHNYSSLSSCFALQRYHDEVERKDFKISTVFQVTEHFEVNDFFLSLISV